MNTTERNPTTFDAVFVIEARDIRGIGKLSHLKAYCVAKSCLQPTKLWKCDKTWQPTRVETRPSQRIELETLRLIFEVLMQTKRRRVHPADRLGLKIPAACPLPYLIFPFCSPWQSTSREFVQFVFVCQIFNFTCFTRNALPATFRETAKVQPHFSQCVLFMKNASK